MKPKVFTILILAALLVTTSGTAFAQGPLPPAGILDSWALPRQAPSSITAHSAAVDETLQGEQPAGITFGTVVNGDFEQGPVIWGQTSTNGFALIEPKDNLPPVPHSGNYAAWLGGGNLEQSTLVQYGIPVTRPASILHLFYIIGSQETVCGNDTGSVVINSTDTVFTWNLCTANNSTNWIEQTIDLSAYDGQHIQLAFHVTTNSSLNSNLFLDDISIGGSFVDVSTSHTYFQDIEILYRNGLTGGCGTNPLIFCPDQIMNRAQAAVFMVRGAYGAGYIPNPTSYKFRDNWSGATYARIWAEAMRENNLTSGCKASPLLYCPLTQLNREQAVVFGLKMKYGTNYLPPPATGTVFADMTNPNYWATPWVEKAYADGLITDCGILNGKPKFCPTVLVTRGLGAYIIVRAKNLSIQ